MGIYDQVPGYNYGEGSGQGRMQNRPRFRMIGRNTVRAGICVLCNRPLDDHFFIDGKWRCRTWGRCRKCGFPLDDHQGWQGTKLTCPPITF
jgi:hypothetical protein